MKAFVNANIYDFKNFQKDCYIIFDKNIEEIGPIKEFNGADEVYDCKNSIVMPGLINCHTHIYSTFSRGMNIPFSPKNFKDILDQLWWKLDGKLNREDVYLSGLVYGMDSIKSGVTTLIDHHASGLCIKGSLNELKKSICDDLGLRGIFCFESSDRFNIDDCIEENIDFCSNKSDKYCGVFGMHASMSLSDKTLEKISNIIGNLPIHIHVAESTDDVYDCLDKYNKPIVKRLDDFKLLNENSILSHCVHINEDEARIIEKRKCYVALNPTSNMNNAVGLSDYDILRRNNIKCMIGNDGLGANITRDYLNLTFAMKNRLKSPTKFSLDDLKEIINNGYEYVSKMLNIKLGRIEEGYCADMIVVPYSPPTPMNSENAIGHVFFGIFDNFHPKHVFAAGKPLMMNYILTFDENEVYNKSILESEKVWGRIKN
ncbi:putative selenium metabolism protein SsnA [Caloramator quimbayensis]|uniref:Putative selenium metabolism protein SsnA n=1 Tax=Caloramator quimbayensis TaxID=1147123 RepID=A0A1T4Y7U3_9CLOT|nr:amidohydrolase family protein [Caloramator quimbayensis]SKA97753.1 putative selenium metabolism protein SsnA [Caloramator quimbayensis]